MSMSVKQQPVTGNEPFLGDVKLTAGQIDLINRSPTLVAQIHEGDARVAAGLHPPMAVKTDIPGNPAGYYDLETKQLQFPPDTFAGPDESAIGTLAHEMGHFIYAPADTAFHQKYIAHLNPRDPGTYNATAMWPVRAEAEAEYNTWKVDNEIRQNTHTRDQPGKSIADYPHNGTIQAIHEADAKRPAGLTEKQNENRLIRTGMNLMAANGGHGADGTYDDYARRITGAAPTEPGGVVSADYRGDDKTGDITSASEHWRSGDVSTQIYKDGKLQSTQTVDASGKPLQASSYTYNADGSYSVTVKNGKGETIQQSDFNADKSGVERGFNADGSRLVTQFNERNQTSQMTQYDRQGRETQRDEFDTNDSRDAKQIATHPDGSRTEYSFDDQRHVGLQTDYDAQGKPVATYGFDSGSVTSTTRYNLDGSRTINTVRPDGTGTQVNVDKQGRRSPETAVTYSQADLQSFAAKSSAAAKIAPPQPVGAANALGGQTTCFDPANNRLTKQLVTNPDGSKTVNSFTDKNTLGSEVKYSADGKPISSTNFDAESGSANEHVTYGADGSREVIRVNHTEHSTTTTSYNAQNQVTRVQLVSKEGIQTDFFDPETGLRTVQTRQNPDGSRAVYSNNQYGYQKARAIYDANGKQTFSVRYDPNEGTGTLTYSTYNPDGSRQVDRVDRDQHTFYTVDRKGQQHYLRSIPVSPADAHALAQWKAGWPKQLHGFV